MPHDEMNPVRHATGSSGQRAEAGLARHLSELARDLQAEPDVPAMLQQITHAAVLEVDGADHAGISLIEGSRVRSEAATDDIVRQLDEEQTRLGQGPCLSSLREEITVRADDLTEEPRWPDFARAAGKFGIRSMLSVQLFAAADNLGALNMYSVKPHAFTDHDESTAMLLAAHAAIAMKGSDVEANLRIALDSRDIIGQAKGILMERFKIGALEAFNLLVTASQHRHHKLRDVAEEVATTGALTTD